MFMFLTILLFAYDFTSFNREKRIILRIRAIQLRLKLCLAKTANLRCSAWPTYLSKNTYRKHFLFKVTPDLPAEFLFIEISRDKLVYFEDEEDEEN